MIVFVVYFICTRKVKLLFYCLYSENTSTVRWCFWRPEVRVICPWCRSYSQGCRWRRGFRPSLTSAVSCETSIAVHVPSLHKSSIAKPCKTSNKCCRVWYLSLLLALQWLRGNRATDTRYHGELVQRVAPQKLANCSVYRYTYVDRS